MSEYEKLVKSLSGADILERWPDVTPMKQISGVPKSEGSNCDDNNKDTLFEGHDQEQIKLMDELCIVLDYDDRPVGAGTKKLCHIMKNIENGLLHRAFSLFVFDRNNRLLLQQRADEKITFPGMWTNTCCSHPLCFSDELGVSPEDGYKTTDLAAGILGAKRAAQRKLEHELGVPVDQVAIEDIQYLTRIHYKSGSGADGKWGEHEIDYILILRTSQDLSINANYNEVKDYKYVSEADLQLMFEDKSLVFTPWFKLICHTFLFRWWRNLDNLDKFRDDSIHRLL